MPPTLHTHTEELSAAASAALALAAGAALAMAVIAAVAGALSVAAARARTQQQPGYGACSSAMYGRVVGGAYFDSPATSAPPSPPPELEQDYCDESEEDETPPRLRAVRDRLAVLSTEMAM